MIDLITIRLDGNYTLPAGAIIKGETANGVMRASLGNMGLFLTSKGLTIRGSLARYLRGENVGEMTLAMVREAIEKLELELGYSIKTGLVRELEIGRTLIVSRPAIWYLELWGTLPGFQKDTYGNGETVLFRNGIRSFQGYDKGREAGEAVPELYKGRFLLRLEMKLKRRVARILDGPVTVERLADQKLYVRLLKAWKRLYFRIPKKRVPHLVFTGGQRDLTKSLAAVGLAFLGGPEGINKDLSSRTDLENYTKSKMKREIRELSQAPDWTDPESLIQELDRKVRGAAAFFR